jgi:hypothetical protein
MRNFASSLVVLFALVNIACGGKTTDPPIDPADSAAPDTLVEDSGTAPDTFTPTDSAIDSEPPPFDAPPPMATEKIDLLFVVDNSISMADKQSELARAIPGMIRDLTTASDGKAVTSLHVGVITSSLGSHGTSACAPELTSRANNDKGHLLPRPGEGAGTGYTVDSTGMVTAAPCPTPVASHALSWVFDPTKEKTDFSGADGAAKIGTASSCVVQSAREQGCGYEETLESMYHFLIDPAPYTKAAVTCTYGISGDACGNNKVVVEGVDAEILAQRASFLRPDSTVVVVVLSDENDFSLKPAGLNWLPWAYGKGQMQRGWAACANVPDDFEPESATDLTKLHTDYKCFSCFENTGDPNCMVKWATDPLNSDVDGRNLRGFQQTKRFGYNFLWSRDRYVSALTKSMVLGSDNKLATNPLFAGGRSPSNVIFAPIVGVPKQLVTNADGTAKVLTSADWAKITGPIAGRDKHMIESIKPREGVPKFAGDRSIDPINGGDRDIYDGDDLQYACIAPRAVATAGNDCEGFESSKRNPLCGPSSTQPYYKAYPGLRHLRLAQSVNGYVASICDPNLGGALKGLVARIKPLIK